MYRLRIFIPDNRPYASPPENGKPRIGLHSRAFSELVEAEFNQGLPLGTQLIHHDNGRTFLDVHVSGEGDARVLNLGRYSCESRGPYATPDRSFARLEKLAQKHGVELELVEVSAPAPV